MIVLMHAQTSIVILRLRDRLIGRRDHTAIIIGYDAELHSCFAANGRQIYICVSLMLQ